MNQNRDRLVGLVVRALEEDDKIASVDFDEQGIFVYFHNGVDYRMLVERA